MTDPRGPASGSARVISGGSWDDVGGHCRSAYRGLNAPDVRDFNLGFRVVLAPGQP